jgi:hypothetical protein
MATALFVLLSTTRTGINPSGVVLADFDGDKILDIATTNRPNFFEPGSISILRGKGDGTFGAALSFPASIAPGGLQAADLTGNGRMDIVTFNQPTLPIHSLSIFLNNGDGSFRRVPDLTLAAVVESIAITDLNGDRIPDLVAAIQGIAISDPGRVTLFLGNGDGTFRPGADYVTTFPGSFVTVQDVTSDKIPDLVVASSNGSVWVFPGIGDGSFRAPVSFLTGSGTTAVAAVDVTGDGILDLVTANVSGQTLSVLIGKGDGLFTTYPNFDSGIESTSLALADLNGDGIPDLVSVSSFGFASVVSVLLGRPDGSYSEPVLFTTGCGAQAVAVGDVNGDGVPDIITANSPTFDSGTVSILLGNGNGTFRSRITIPLRGSASAVAVVDVDGDHIPDLALTTTGSFPLLEER